jgi:hypothetical protein
LAEVEALPDDLKPIGRRISGQTVALMSQAELLLRAEYVHELESRATSEPPDKAQRTRKLAEQVIRSLSDFSFSAAQAELSAAVADAQRRGDDRGAFEALAGLRALEHQNPRLPLERINAYAAGVAIKTIERKVSAPIPPRVGSRLFSRKKGRK